MIAPSIISRLKDERSGVTYDIYAYRHLTTREITEVVRQYVASTKGRRKKVEHGQTIKIKTIIGHNQ